LGRDLAELRAKQYEIDNPIVYQEEVAKEPAEPNFISQGNEPQAPESVDSQAMELSQKHIAKEEMGTLTPTSTSPELKIEELSGATSTLLQSSKTLQPPQTEHTVADDVEAVATPVKNDVIKDSIAVAKPEEMNGLGTDIEGTVPSAASEAPATTGLQDTSLDDLFDIGGAGDGDLNFDDFDFNTGNSNQDFDQNDGGLDLSSFGNQASNKDDDVSNLLPGLESYGDGNEGGDFNSLDLSSTTNNLGVGGTEDFGMSGGDLDMALGMGNNESAFDDLLEGMDMDDFVDDGTNEFDDTFFGLDNDG
jgi:hypothetical protein